MRFFLILSLFTYTTFAQKFEFTPPVRLGSQINSSAEELYPILSLDGETLYFARALDPDNKGGELSGIDIWISTKDQFGHWQQATNNANNWNNKDNNAVIGLSKTGSVAYLLNAYERGDGIAFSKILNGKWTTPERIVIPGIKQNEIASCYMNPGFDVLLISMKTKSSIGEEDLFVSLKDSLEIWSEPMSLGLTINTEGYEMSPFLSQDETRIYFSSDGHAGYGEADIFMAERLYGSWNVWSKPQNLGKTINSPKFDAYFSIQNDSLVFLSSNRDSDLADIYQGKALISNDELIIKDSVDRIVKQTKQLLTDLKETKEKSVIETVTFESKAASISLQIKQQLGKKIMATYNFKLPGDIEILGYYIENGQEQYASDRLLLARLKNTFDFLTSLGIKPEKVTTRSIPLKGSDLEKINSIEIKF